MLCRTFLFILPLLFHSSVRCDEAVDNSQAAEQDSENLRKQRDDLWRQANAARQETHFAEAIGFGERMLAVEKAWLGDEDSEVTATIAWLAGVDEQAGNWESAIARRRTAWDRRIAALGNDAYQTIDARLAWEHSRLLSQLTDTQRSDLQRAEHLLSQGRKAYRVGQHTDAFDATLEASQIFKVVLGEEHRVYANTLNTIGAFYTKLGDYGRAEALLEQTRVVRKKVLGEQHPEFASGLNDLAGVCKAIRKYATAERLYKQARPIWKKTRGEDHPDYANSLLNLADLYELMGDYPKALPLVEQALKIRKKVFGEDHPDYATGLHILARLNRLMCDYAKAESHFEQALEIRKRALGEEHPEYTNSLNSLAVLYKEIGDYAKALPLYEQALEIEKRVGGEEHLSYATMLFNLASLYEAVGDYAKAVPLYQQSRDIRKRVGGEEHPDYVNSLSKFASLYEVIGDYGKALPLYEQCRDITMRVLGDEHPNYATILNNLAVCHMSMSDYGNALPLLEQALRIRKKVFGEHHPEYTQSLENVASLHSLLGEYAKAEPLFEQALKIRKKVHGREHPDYATTLDNMASVYEMTGDYGRSEQFASDSLRLTRSLLDRSAVILSERQQLAMSQMLRHRLDSYVSLTLESDEFLSQAARQVLQWKGATLVRQRSMRRAADEPGIADGFAKLQQVTRQLAALSRAAPTENIADWKQQISQLTHDKERLEAQLSRDSASFRAAMQKIKFEQIQAAIPANGVLVDFLQFERSTPAERKGQRDKTTSLLAVIVKGDGEPQLMELGPIASLSEAIDTWRLTFGMSPQGKRAGLAIRQQIWEPLLKHINDAKTVLVSTDGVLGRLPLAALPGTEAGTYLIEDHHLAMIPVPQLLPALVNDLGTKQLDRELLLLGDVDYDSTQSEIKQDDGKKRRKKRRPGKNRADLVETEFSRLPGTATEVNDLQVLYGELFEADDDDVMALKKAEATEASIRSLAGQFRHVHLATHGFFASADHKSALSTNANRSAMDRGHRTIRDSEVTGWNPGLLSGLALAGANLEPAPGQDDGILTAQEIAFLPLNGVDTVVLSACQTGLGEAAGGEGLIGIQRSFQIAGVRTTVASLWKVDDVVTQRLMSRFYRNLWDNEMSRLDALREAQLYILNHPDSIRGASITPSDAPDRTPPYFWAAFQLSGDWR
ncbi:CHAT domain-containing protein [Fuerstiella marisgermanici]|uniref:Photosystem I assembly protein Ycf3 n=1 Tax=Fuerstiella marisgermanici TaxID=1891926 RepID=A0A1P8WGN7_9PLAN|nr:CHAT domain-containing tetratricopeptide repeat protein [Fuerstiella marisgermanici]APZ93239.1 photosystem I assembly protein Ycf3 [Fuerstiella marisgermanici]